MAICGFFLVRLKGEWRKEGEESFLLSEFPPRPGSHLLKVGLGVEVGSGCGWQYSTVAGWREKRKLLEAVSFLQLFFGLSTCYSLRPRTQKPKNPRCLR